MSSNKGDQPPPTSTGDPEPPDSSLSSSADIKPPTLSESETADADVDPPIGGGATGGGIKDSSGIGE